MYYIDGTRYDHVDGTGPVVPSSLTDGVTGLDTWSRLFYLVHGPVTALPRSLISLNTVF